MGETLVPHNSTSQGLSHDAIQSNAVIICGLIAVIFVLNFLMTPRLDPDEPPLLKPTVPWIGHIIGILWHQNDYHRILFEKHGIPIASLQMLWGKIYAVWEPSLGQATLRARGPSFEPFVVEFAQKSFGLSAETFAKVTTQPNLVPKFTEAIHSSMQAAYLHKMNVNALNYISKTLETVRPGPDGGLEVGNLYLWLRDLISFATTRALLGKEDPFEKDPTLLEDMWNFETGLPSLLTRPLPSLTVRKAYLSRNRLQAVMSEYYTAQHDHDPSAAQLTRGRADCMRAFGFSGAEVAQFEIVLPVVGTTNSAPTMYWMFCFVFARPALVGRLRAEVLPLVRRGGDEDEATLDISQFEAECPLLVSCYRETVRLVNHSVSMRRVVADTTVVGAAGRSYVLKAGVDVQIPAGIAHRLPGVWGEDAAEFDPERFLPEPEKSAQKADGGEKAKKNAYIPFGGGKHLCPGRYFAFAEILGIMTALVLGFELEPVGMAFDGVRANRATLANAIVKPENEGRGLGVKITRRKGWERTKWNFEC